MTKLFCERCGQLVFAAWMTSPQEVRRAGDIYKALTPEDGKALRRAWDKHEGQHGHTCRLRLRVA